MKILKTLVLLSFLESAFAQIISVGTCPPVETQKNFNYTKFLGRWYQYERLFSRVETGTTCNFYDYTPGEDDNPLKLTETFSYHVGDLVRVTNVASASRELYVIDEDYPAELETQFPATPPFSPSNLFILETDYDNYAVVYSCTERGPVKSIYAWLEFRKRHPKKSVIKKAYKVLKKTHIDRSDLIKTGQTGCSDDPELISELF